MTTLNENAIAEALSDREGLAMLTLLLAEILGPKALRPNLGPHVHKCGFDKDDQRGCGYEWTHDGREAQAQAQAVYDRTGSREAADQAYADAHACPQCGRGPWTLQVTPETIRAMEELRSEAEESA